MTEHAPDRIWSGIDIPKTIAGVLAAVSAAVVGSFTGVAGTLVGAAVASLIGSVGTEIYHRSLNRGRKKIEGTFLAPAAVGTPPVEAAAEDKPSAPPTPRNIRWGRVAMVAGSLFVLAIGTLTAAELVSGKSIADATRGGSGDSTTVSSLFSDKSGSEESTPAESPSVSPTSTQPADQNPTDQPTQQATTDPATTDQPTEAPATDAPTGGTDSGGTGTGTGTDSGNAPKSDTQGADTQNLNDGTE
ncbi:superantigen-like protein SSL4 [Paractinoplanes durhamensis]|uniref:Uncharacterized protein n=1 Tax=Paractinoplanes durhamensis TaxID=113563 RepID=A0ABQ3YX77_9ACTN|nr:hypothetical protein [Actinoplanes durhamensis]GIE02192.1 hypothetical protein Adu01nite_35420 [Actinoplanes durhamensis]